MSATLLDLRPHFNARAATHDGERHRGGFNAWGNSFPAEELPFGDVVTIDGMPFVLARSGDHDHLEAAGQCIEIPAGEAGSKLALLAFGEMGPQELEVSIESDGARDSVTVVAPGWLVEGTSHIERALDCTHLHYPGGYDLSHLRPVMWPCRIALPRPARPSRITLETNPLFHIAAATLLA